MLVYGHGLLNLQFPYHKCDHYNQSKCCYYYQNCYYYYYYYYYHYRYYYYQRIIIDTFARMMNLLWKKNCNAIIHNSSNQLTHSLSLTPCPRRNIHSQVFFSIIIFYPQNAVPVDLVSLSPSDHLIGLGLR